MADFDFRSAARMARQTTHLSRRVDADLPFLTPSNLAGPGILLDTSVYIDQLQGRLSPLVARLSCRAFYAVFRAIGTTIVGRRFRTASCSSKLTRTDSRS